MSRQLGQQHEALAEDYLVQRGLTPRARNVRGPRGEIDLILIDRNTLVFVEVRYRKHRTFASAAESIDARKQHRIITTAEHYLQRHSECRNQPCRFDVLACDGDSGFTWIKNAFDT